MVPITNAPHARASCTATVPTPPLAPCMRMRSAGLRPAPLKKSPIRGHTGKSHRRTLLKRNGIGQEMNSLRITDNLLSISPRIASRRKSRHKNPITGFTALHPLAHLVHNSRAIKPGGIGQCGFEEGILARSDIGFGRIDPRRIQPNTDLPMFRFWFRNVRKAQTSGPPNAVMTIARITILPQSVSYMGISVAPIIVT